VQLDIGARRVDANGGLDARVRQGKGEAPCAAPDVQNSLPRAGSDELNEQRREPLAPPPHEALVGSRVCRHKRGRRTAYRPALQSLLGRDLTNQLGFDARA
jgi:hypothetical protein